MATDVSGEVHDVQRDLAVEIARELESEGTSVRIVQSIPQQRVIDVSWAAKRAGRIIGQHVRTSVTPLTPRPDGEVAVVAVIEPDRPTYADGRVRLARQRRAADAADATS